MYGKVLMCCDIMQLLMQTSSQGLLHSIEMARDKKKAIVSKTPEFGQTPNKMKTVSSK